MREIRKSRLKVETVSGSIYSDADMRKAGVHVCDTVIIVGGSSYQDREVSAHGNIGIKRGDCFRGLCLCCVSQIDTMLLNCLTRLRAIRSQASKETGQLAPLRVVSCVSSTQTYLAATDIARRSTAAGDPMNVELITTSQLTGGYMTQVWGQTTWLYAMFLAFVAQLS